LQRPRSNSQLMMGMFSSADRAAATGTTGGRPGQRKRLEHGRRLTPQVRALCGPVALHHDRQAMDDDIEEAADHEPEHSGGEGKHRRIGKQGGHPRRLEPA
jgi:hypothetical protein